MPRPQHPPTPASSTEIKSKDGSRYPTLQMSFELPPPAVAGSSNSSQSTNSTASRKPSTASSSSYQPGSPTSPATAGELVKTRRRSSIVAAPNKDAFALPPPPTRSRKIIQMKPRAQVEETAEAADENAKTVAKTPAGGKKKQPSSTSVAGRKIARKTAHSLIERRRRSKMNEEFGVLKDMIPACTGDMHKLAILQASIDYIRYLEDCVSKLQKSNAQSQATAVSENFMLPPPASLAAYVPRQYQPSEHDQEDIDMEGSDQATSPTNTAHAHSQTHSSRPSVSPAILPQDRHDSYSSASTDRRHYSFSAGTSPALGPQLGTFRSNGYGSALTSPALMPQRGSIGERDLDHEATAALLMLNTDRRGVSGIGVAGSRTMSVRDMLSS